MKIQIIGTGIVGEATARLALELGNEVWGYDIIPKDSPYYQKGLIPDADINFICVMEKLVTEVIQEYQDKLGLLVVRSSVQPFVIEQLIEKYRVPICHNPEFLIEATYLRDAINPKMIVYGGKDYGLLSDFYANYQGRIPVIHTDLRTASMVNLLNNNYLTTLVSFWCEAKLICDKIGVDVQTVAHILATTGIDIRGTSYR